MASAQRWGGVLIASGVIPGRQDGRWTKSINCALSIHVDAADLRLKQEIIIRKNKTFRAVSVHG